MAFHNSWRKVRNSAEEKCLGIFTKIGITFSYGTRITKFLACWKYCYDRYVVAWYRAYFGLSIVSSSCDLRKVWWCSPMHYDVYFMMMMHKRCTLRWWWCIFGEKDAYPMTMMHTLWRCFIPMMMMDDDASLMFS